MLEDEIDIVVVLNEAFVVSVSFTRSSSRCSNWVPADRSLASWIWSLCARFGLLDSLRKSRSDPARQRLPNPTKNRIYYNIVFVVSHLLWTIEQAKRGLFRTKQQCLREIGRIEIIIDCWIVSLIIIVDLNRLLCFGLIEKFRAPSHPSRAFIPFQLTLCHSGDSNPPLAITTLGALESSARVRLPVPDHLDAGVCAWFLVSVSHPF